MEIKRLFDIPYYQKSKHPLQKALAGKYENGKDYSYSTDQVLDLMNKISLGLYQIGLKPGDKVAMVSYNNRPEWNIVDMAMQQIGVINVPVYPTISAAEYVYIFNDAEVKYCFVGYGDLLDKVRKAQKDVPSMRGIFTFDDVKGQKDANGNDVHFWETIFASGDLAPVEEIKKTIQSSDLATIIYTSGTTGNPKGVMLSHWNIISNIMDALPLVPLVEEMIALSFLPICHIFERTITYAYMVKSVSIVYAPSIDKLKESLLEVRPHFFTTVPRLLEKVYEKIALGTKGSWLKNKMFHLAESMAAQYEYDKPLSGLSYKLVDTLVFKKIRAAMGGRVRGVITGAAACPRKMAQFFSAAGVPIREGYGLTETSPAISIALFEPYKALLGTVGPILPSVQVKIDKDEAAYGEGAGEILVKGPNVMMGYYNKPDATAEVIDKDGWFHTGDVGKLVKNEKGVEFLKITDRKKELLKTSGGKYVAPSPIESKFKESFYIEQAMVVGENRKFVSAIFTVTEDALKGWCHEHSIAWTNLAEMLKHPKVLEKFQHTVDEYNPNFNKVEQVKKFLLVPDTWGVETGELTPTMKLKRRVVLQKYAAQIEKMYEGSGD